MEATKAGKLKVPQPILDIEKQLKEDYQKRYGIEQKSRIEQDPLAKKASSRIKSVATGCKEEEVEDQTEDGDSFPMGDTYMYTEESSGRKDYEAEQQAKAKTRQEKYKAAKISGILEPL